MKIYNERHIIEIIKEEYILKHELEEETEIHTKVFVYGMKGIKHGKISVMIVVMGETIGVVGFGMFFAEKNKLIIYDFNGDIISIHNNSEFKSLNKGKELIKI